MLFQETASDLLSTNKTELHFGKLETKICEIYYCSLSTQPTTSDLTAMKRWNKELLVLQGKTEGTSTLLRQLTHFSIWHRTGIYMYKVYLPDPTYSPTVLHRTEEDLQCQVTDLGASSPNISYQFPRGSIQSFSFCYGGPQSSSAIG